jgi:5-methylcytosine-specific restriction protein A
VIPKPSGFRIPQVGWVRATDEGAEEWFEQLDEIESDGQTAHRNPPWQRDELILALDLYFRHPPNSIGQDHPEVIQLSEILNNLPIHQARPDAQRFRNPNGVYMKLCNFLRFDPTYQGTGLSRGNRLEEKVWNEFANDRGKLARIAEAIQTGYPSTEAAAQEDDEEEELFPEGRILFRLHRSRERNRNLVRRAKERAKQQHGRLACVVCDFDFAAVYGPIGEDFIECHHTRSLSELQDERPTRLDEIALVCPNCHRMIHRKRPWLGIEELATLIQGKR